MGPAYADACINRGVAKANISDYRGAIQDYSKAIELDPAYAGAYVNRGIAKGVLGDYTYAPAS
jgi:tetratricopeptide (TPR) repeat protein